MKPFLALAVLAMPVAAIAAPASRQITVEMTSSGFVPRIITMRPGRPYVMRFVNHSDRGHDFSPGRFFNAARVTRGGYAIRGNKIDLDPGQSATIRLTAPDTPGARYTFRSHNVADVASGLKGYIYIR